MILPSYSFVFIFLPIVVIGYFLINSRGLYTIGKSLLLIASLGFYYSMGWQGFTVLLASIVICYLIATFGFAEKVPAILQKVLLTISIIANISLLLYCKYLGYFDSLFTKYTGSGLSLSALVVPVGISYFTFSQVSYLVDSYRVQNTKYSILDYALFVSFFPKITVGPIAFASEIIPQFNDLSRKSIDDYRHKLSDVAERTLDTIDQLQIGGHRTKGDESHVQLLHSPEEGDQVTRSKSCIE